MEETLWRAIKRLEPLAPRFVSVTYGAGGSTRERTHRTVKRILAETALLPAAHLTCVAATRAEVDEVARDYWDAGVRQIVALRGDPPKETGAAPAQSRRLRLRRRPRGRAQAHRRLRDHGRRVPRGSSRVHVGVCRPRQPEAEDRRRCVTRHHPVLLRERHLLPLPGAMSQGRHHLRDRARHHARDELQADDRLRRIGRRERAALDGHPVRGTGRRPGDAEAHRRDGGGGAGPGTRGAGRARVPLLHAEPRRPDVRHLPPARSPGAAGGGSLGGAPA